MIRMPVRYVIEISVDGDVCGNGTATRQRTCAGDCDLPSSATPGTCPGASSASALCSLGI